MKKLLLIVLSVILCLVFAGCKNEENPKIEPSENLDSITESFFDEPIEDNEYESSSSGTLLFTTEYEVVDYVENAIIVSKNDGLLYGVLDNRGNVILPISYDSVEFLNKKDYQDGYSDIYLRALYENENYIFDLKANEIIQSDIGVGYVDTAINEYVNEDTVLFYELTTDEYKFYNKDGKLLGSCKKTYQYDSRTWTSLYFLSNNYFMCANTDGVGVLLCDYNGTTIERIDGAFGVIKLIENEINNTSYAYFSSMKENKLDNSKFLKIEFDRNGKIINKYELSSMEYHIDKDAHYPQKYNLYQTNGTWKLEDLDGNTLYDDRYYSKVYSPGKHECALLTDEDNYITIIGRKGNRFIESGKMQLEGESAYLLGFNNKEKAIAIYEGANSMILTTNTSYGTNIYYYE